MLKKYIKSAEECRQACRDIREATYIASKECEVVRSLKVSSFIRYYRKIIHTNWS